jgi:hypothetical protein
MVGTPVSGDLPPHFHGFMEVLAALPDNAARAAQCLAWQQQASSDWSQGQDETVADMLASTDPRYRKMTREQRTLIGRRKWSTSYTARSLAGDEELFARWAVMYGVMKD